VSSVDWSATGDLFKLASSVLLDKFDEAVRVMKSIGVNEKVLNKAYYKDWPIFKKFRATELFKDAYLEVYGVSFEVVEEPTVS